VAVVSRATHAVFNVEGVATYFANERLNGDYTFVQMWNCQRLHKTAYTAPRYNQYVKAKLKHVNEIKAKFVHQTVTSADRQAVIQGLNQEFQDLEWPQNLPAGRWFHCGNGHKSNKR
jgi:hypothetical protein